MMYKLDYKRQNYAVIATVARYFVITTSGDWIHSDQSPDGNISETQNSKR